MTNKIKKQSYNPAIPSSLANKNKKYHDPIKIIKSAYADIYINNNYDIAIGKFEYTIKILQKQIAEHPDNKKILQLADACYAYLINLTSKSYLNMSWKFIDQRETFRKQHGMKDAPLNIPRDIEKGILDKTESIDDILKKD